MGTFLFLFGMLATLCLNYNFWTMMEPSNGFSTLMTVIIVIVMSTVGVMMSICAAMGYDKARKK